ncbi:MAG: PHP domain-containing protein [Candidatus Electrothrix sp. GW3-4]|uniref:PHP domain-containing protein n=1 Tax=Candidatus Electrothrix sp. GW3-4 TaxID=3126740 RepID=UPI0030CC67ED
MCVELHTHSVYSDGTATPAELVQMAVDRRLQGFSLTDHDTVEGVQEVLRLGQEVGMPVVSGIEISARHRQYSLHILGYGIDPTNQELLQWLVRLQQGRVERNKNILEKLTTMGISITEQELEQVSECGQTGRPHIARLMKEKGHVTSSQQAFTHYLGRNKPAWCHRSTCSVSEAIAVLHQAGGLAVLAHPGIIDKEMKMQPLLVQELVERGLDGLEVFYPSHSRKIKKRLQMLAGKYNLLCTGGSDYHGDQHGRLFAGEAGGICPPDSIMVELLERLQYVQQ